jgi:hypothetical protein
VSLKSAVSLESGFAHTCVLNAAGPFCWGRNAEGQLGDGTTTNRLTPTPVLSFSLNIDPAVSIGGSQSKRADVVILANCAEGARLRVDVELTQGSVSGEGSANVDCTGTLGRYPVNVHIRGNPEFVPGAAVASATAEVRMHGQTIDQLRWTRNVVIHVE